MTRLEWGQWDTAGKWVQLHYEPFRDKKVRRIVKLRTGSAKNIYFLFLFLFMVNKVMYNT
ncbi:MAG: hypothetical protein WAL46_02190 [Nitrososphaeraceae archaeon]